jgi:hypothetical protein
MSSLLLTTPILHAMRPIEGWLEEDEADLLIAAASRALQEMPAVDALVEIGSFCGKSTVVLASVVQKLAPACRVYAIDPHEGEVGAADQGITRCERTLKKLQRNVAAAEVAGVVQIIQKRSYEVDWSSPISLLFIDGLHDYVNVARDFYHFERWLVPGAYVAFHDYANYYPGVMTFVDELERTGTYKRIHLQRSLALLQRMGGDPPRIPLRS